MEKEYKTRLRGDGQPMPLDKLQWIHRDEIRPNDYNPNAVAPTEMTLLKTSILEDGWTQPIVILEDKTIVDGFHRWTTSGDPDVYGMTDGYVPVVVLTPRSDEHKMLSTVRHNRARGRHGVLKMGKIVSEMLNSGLTIRQICQRLQMEKEEVIRLTSTVGVMAHPDLDNPYSKSWIPGDPPKKGK